MSENTPTAQATLEPDGAHAHHYRPQGGDERSVRRSHRGERAEDVPLRSETTNLDLAALAATLSQRLHAAGMPVTPDRAVTFAEALILVGPGSRRHLYCTARAVFVSAHAQLPVFDRVFDAVFAGPHESRTRDLTAAR